MDLSDEEGDNSAGIEIVEMPPPLPPDDDEDDDLQGVSTTNWTYYSGL